MLRVHAISLGCPKNRVDTEGLLGSLGPVETVAAPEDADLVFINTCGFIQPAVREGIRAILEVAQAAGRARKRPLVAVGGCLVGRYGAQELAREIPEVDVWLDNREAERWPGILQERLGLSAQAGRLVSTPPSYAYLKIAEGCDHACSFCTIPAIRGPLRSAPPEALTQEARTLAENGARELVLVAQDVTAWGRDRQDGRHLRHLIEALLPTPGLAWIRLMYLYPAGLDDDFLRFARDVSQGESGARLLPYFDIPLQHADPDILARMGRPFAADPQKTIDRVRAALPEAALRTSLIVGFPGESERQFERLLEFVERNRFHHLGVFPFEAEGGTKAAAMEGQLGRRVKRARRDAVMAIQKAISRELLRAEAGTRQDVLVDAASGEWPGLHVGRVWFQAPEVDGVTYVSGPGVAPGALLSAEIVESGEYDLTALV